MELASSPERGYTPFCVWADGDQIGAYLLPGSRSISTAGSITSDIYHGIERNQPIDKFLCQANTTKEISLS